MMKRTNRGSLRLTLLLCIAAVSSQNAGATIVEFQTVMGNFEVNLYDNSTPATVANFMNYVNNGRYTNAIYHRSVAGFILQGGGFSFATALPVSPIPANAPVANEPRFSNVRGTIAMAKVANNPNSATSQWYINLADNSGNLDSQNGGFTAFGEVVGNGMIVVDAIAALPTFDFGSPIDSLPLKNYSSADFNNSVVVDNTHVIIINAVIISDSTVDSAAGLNPVPNTSNSGGVAPAPASAGGGGGGSTAVLSLLMLLWLIATRPLSCGRRPSTLR